MNNPIKEIVRFNEQAGLLEAGYDDFLESSFQIEEALEGFKDGHTLACMFHERPTFGDSRPKELARTIVRLVGSECDQIPDVDRLDKACDAVVFAVGSMAKLGLNAQQITKALNIVMRCNFQKLQNKQVDSAGKLMKSNDFIGPEGELQQLLDKRQL